jgi:hypothetical protein
MDNLNVPAAAVPLIILGYNLNQPVLN